MNFYNLNKISILTAQCNLNIANFHHIFYKNLENFRSGGETLEYNLYDIAHPLFSSYFDQFFCIFFAR